jgi:TonB-dependent receptor
MAGAALIASLTASSAFAGAAIAADDEAEAEVIVVRGFRGALNQALSVKRNNTGVVDAIVAEDIADFPDLNLAEAIQRLPGIAIDRDAGEGRTVTVRGLSPDFTRVRINGMEGLSTTGGTDSSGGANRARTFDFNTFASELFQSITVRKTQSSSVEEGSLGSTIDLRTSRPFDFDGFTTLLAGQGGYNDLSEEFNPRVAGLISNETADGTFGWLISGAYSDRSLLEEGHSTVRWQNANEFQSVGGVSCAPNPDPAECAAVNQAFHPRIPRYGRLTHDQERIGITGALQFRPTDRTQINVDALYSKFEATRSEQFLEEFALSRAASGTPQIVGKPAVDVTGYEIDSRNNLIFAQLNDVDIYTEHRFDVLETQFTQFTVDFTHDVTDRFRLSGFAGTAESDYDNPIQSTILFTNWDADGYSYDYRPNANAPLINYGFNVDDPSNWLLTEFRDRPNSVLNTFDTARLEGAFDLNDSVTLSGGLMWKQYAFDVTESRRDRQLTAAQWIPVTAGLATTVSGFGDGLGMPSGSLTSWLTPDIDAAAALVDLYNQPLTLQAGAANTVEEDDTGGYVQVDFDTTLGGMGVRGDVGVRYVETQTASTGIISGATVTVDNEYTDTLPSLNLAFEPVDDIILRFGAAKVISRPTLASLTPGGTINATAYTVSYGNPLLDPFRATNLDLSLEWYFAEESLIALAFFHKDIESFIARTTDSDVPFSTTGLPNSAVPANLPLGNDLSAGLDPLVDVTRNINGDGGDLQGWEIQYQQPFTMLPAPFDRFGITANYTYVESEVNYGTAAAPNFNELLLLSPYSYNATLYYEDERLSARVAVNARDQYLTTFPGRNGNDEEGKNDTMNVDASASYQITDNLQITFEGINLTDEFNHQYVDTVNRVSVYHHTGREFLFGVRWRR